MGSQRLLRWGVGLTLLAGYVGAGAGVYLLLRSLLTPPPDLLEALAAIAVVPVVGAYASYRFGTRQLLAGLEAKAVGPRELPRFFRRLESLTERMDAGRPEVYVARLGAPNALALGGVRSGRLVVDVSLFRLLEPAELEAIVAHELAHLESNDALVQTVAYSALRTVVGLLMLPLLPVLLVAVGVARASAWIRGRPQEWSRSPVLAVYLWLSLGVTVLSLAVTVLIRAHSRRREYAADDRAVEVTENPMALASGLRKIQRATNADRSLLSTLFVDGDEEGTLTRLLSTHPPMDDRIDRLLETEEPRDRTTRRG